MKQKFILKTMLLLLCMIVGLGNAWATDVTFTPGTDTGDKSVTKSGVTCTMSTMNNTSYYQIYANSSGTFSMTSGTITKIEFTCTASGTSKYGPGNASANVGSYKYSGSTGTWTGSASSVTISSTAQVRMSSLTITYTPATPAYTIAAKSNNESYGTVSLSGSVITGSPKDGYRYASPAYTVDPANSATVAQDGNAFTVTPSANTTVTINFVAIPTHTATFSVNGVTTTQDLAEGAAIVFPANPADISDNVFVGWTTSAIEGTTNVKPDFVTSATMGNADATYYAVFAEVTPGTATTKTDNLKSSTFGSPSNYGNWSGKSATGGSDAVYAGNSTTDDAGDIQIRTTNSNSGIVTTKSGGKAKKVTVVWATSTVADRTLEIYGVNTPYSGATDLYDDKKKGTLLGSIVKGTSTELTISGDYAYIGLRSKNGAMFLKSISIDWESGTPDTYSDYCTTVVAAAVEKPVITLDANPFLFSTTATITCATEGATIKYSYDGENWNDYTEALTITATTTIYAKAIKGVDESSIVQVTATKNLAEPTVTISATDITNTNVFTGTAAGSLAASVTYNDAAVEGAAVTWSGNKDEVATIDPSTGAVTLVAAGTVTFTATYAGNSDYCEKAATYEMTVTNSDPNANDGSAEKPYNVAEAIAYINTLGSSTSTDDVYVSGIVSQIDSYNSSYKSITYWISDDGTTKGQMEVYSGKGLDGADFSAVTDLTVGDVVTVKGKVKMFNSTPEFDKSNQLVSHVQKVATPIFSPAAGVVAADTEVTISCATEGATIYYTTDGSDPTTSSSVYADPIVIDASKTIKAFAVKDGRSNSEIATALYTVAELVATPTFSPAAGTYSSAQNVTIICATENATIYYTTDGTDPTTSSTEYTGAIAVEETMIIKAIAAKEGEVNSAIATADYTINIPSISTGNINLTFSATSGSIAYEIVNPVEGGELTAAITDGNEGGWLTLGDVDASSVALICEANDDDERTATVTLTYTYDTDKTVTKVVTIKQNKYVVDYATLPFEFNRGSSDIASTTGLTQSGLGSDYASKPYLKFDGTGDYVILKIAEAPGKLTFDIKGNSFSGGTFMVQTSTDGETYSDLKSYTSILSETKTEEFASLNVNVRYIKWIYTNKSSGNVALGNIKLQKMPPATPVFSVAEGEYDEAKNVELSCATDGATIYYTTNGDTPTSSSTEYTGGISITETTTVKAIAIKDEVASAVASATYTMNRPAAPAFDPAAFVFDAAFDVHLSTETDGATIYYTTDDSTPTSSSTAYDDKNGISISTGSDVTVKAIAFKNGLTSDVATVTYTYDARITPSFSLSSTELNLKVNDASDAVTLTTNSDGEVAFTCEDAHVTLSGTGNSRTISANAAGTYTVNVSVTGSATYKDAEGTITVTVTKKAATMAISTVFDDGLDLRYAHGGVIEGIVKYNDIALDPQPTVTFASSDENVATVDEEGNITFKKVGTTKITASFAGDDEYEECEDGYDLVLFDTTPQATKVDITLNNTFFGCSSFTSWTTGMATSLSGVSENVTVTYGKGTSANMYCNSEKVRYYTNNTFTIDAPTGYHVIAVDMNVAIGSATPSGTVTSDTWEGDASSVSFTFANKTDISSISVTLAPVVTLNKYGYATYCSPHPIDFSKAEGFTAWRISDVDANGTVTFSKITETIKEGQGVLLYNKDADGENKTTVTLTVGESEGATEYTTSENKLVGITEPTAIEADTYYGLKDNTFVKVKAGTIPAGKALLPADVIPAGARELNFVFEGEQTTSVSEECRVKSEEFTTATIFDLQGRKVNKPQKGLYIVNGRKVVVK